MIVWEFGCLCWLPSETEPPCPEALGELVCCWPADFRLVQALVDPNDQRPYNVAHKVISPTARVFLALEVGD